ncbi:DUF3995 domain-containing protein [Zhihengliuella halotolerans]|uniref:Uncharacterized protein DUF3995 n=1 Tax=Zhihengliuella halotolerans TaxID=370736 RepID=A0A4Q8AGE8_9MICC|nr:DUF3995 domain-containing protein [Zhihengliuella halotolerans]RZU62825.1 uncharacterized protein DUF3995 [Zhihengliuella halotolerans]
MNTAAAVLLILVGVLHSILGERVVLRPLFAGSWELALSRGAAERLLRGAWHLTSLAWWGLSATLLGAPAGVAFGLVCLLSAATIHVCLPGHLAWPLFTAAGVLSLGTAEALPTSLLIAVVAAAAAAATVAAGFHIAWAAGVRRGLRDALPQASGSREPLGRPGRGATLAVAGALGAYVVVVAALVLGAEGALWRWCAIAALVVLAVRVVGEGRYVGITKRVRNTGFARADDRYWTPVVGLLGLGSAAALALAG